MPQIVRQSVSGGAQTGDVAIIVHIEEWCRTQRREAPALEIASQGGWPGLASTRSQPGSVDERVRRGALVDAMKNKMIDRVLPRCLEVRALTQVPSGIKEG